MELECGRGQASRYISVRHEIRLRVWGDRLEWDRSGACERGPSSKSSADSVLLRRIGRVVRTTSRPTRYVPSFVTDDDVVATVCFVGDVGRGREAVPGVRQGAEKGTHLPREAQLQVAGDEGRARGLQP